MKKITLILLSYLFVNTVFSQVTNDDLIINSLSYLNKELHLNFEGSGKYILVLYKGESYIVDEYYIRQKNRILIKQKEQISFTHYEK